MFAIQKGRADDGVSNRFGCRRCPVFSQLELLKGVRVPPDRLRPFVTFTQWPCYAILRMDQCETRRILSTERAGGEQFLPSALGS